ncbi:DUF3429 family protein [Litorivicinus lipolyticus]|uniref:DUF3429 family protein n=1 Tax=Litorivicinus lipolyticus TaxID=418701 RepID=A0A5Q2QD40_9GAMM|nr:DUF3429 domain-containing protein [Litorivicinus lipolyticus]QGG79760.1 DUF3429 family protein [Litorivicinus lipolyticus]
MDMKWLRILGYAGLAPFAATAMGHWAGLPVDRVGLVYGAVILSFLGGIQWGSALHASAGQRERLVASVVPSLIAWIAVLLAQPFASVVLIGGFIGQWLFDRRHANAAQWPLEFVVLRTHLTLGACVGLGALLV